MAFVVTARKYRPILFSDVVGQEHITNTLKNAILKERIAHAYLFTGPRGVGKTTTARILSKAVNCLNSDTGEPCNECDNCKLIQNSQMLDIIEIDAASNRGIDEIRTLRESVKYAPATGKYKVYIIDEVHMLTKDSFNAFLKTLEEPPANTIFIFATTDVHKLPLTIISRCQRYDFRRIPVERIKSLLQEIADKEKITIDDKTLTLIARKSDGGLRDAESFFDQAAAFCADQVDYETVIKVFNFIDDEIYFRTTDAITDKNFGEAFDICNRIYASGWSFVDYIDGLIEHLRNILTINISGNTELIETAAVFKEKYLQMKFVFTNGDILRALNYLAKLNSELKFSQNHKLKVEIALSQLIGLQRTSTFNEILSLLEDNVNIKMTGNYASNPQPEKKFTTETTGSMVQQPAPTPNKTPMGFAVEPKVEYKANINVQNEVKVETPARQPVNVQGAPKFFQSLNTSIDVKPMPEAKDNSVKPILGFKAFEAEMAEKALEEPKDAEQDEDIYVMGIKKHLRAREIF